MTSTKTKTVDESSPAQECGTTVDALLDTASFAGKPVSCVVYSLCLFGLQVNIVL